MKRQSAICLLIILLISFQELAFSQKIYVSPTGTDTNPGTIDKPFNTLTAARDKARELRKSMKLNEPLEIIAAGGEYFMIQPLFLTTDDSGTPASPLVFKAETGKKAVFRGGIPVSGFEKVNNKLWRAFIPQVAWYDSYFEQLYVNGRRAVRAKSPNDGFFRVKNVTETVLEKGEGRSPELAVQKVELDNADTASFASFSKHDFQDALIVFYHNWDNTRKRVTGFSKEGKTDKRALEGIKDRKRKLMNSSNTD